MADGRVIIETKLDTSGLTAGAKTAETTVDNLGKSMESAGAQSNVFDAGIKNITSSLKSLETIAKSSFVMKLASKAVTILNDIGNETSVVVEKMKAASTLFGDVAVDQTNLLNNLYKISNETGESMEVLGQSVYDALSASVEPTEDMANVLKVVSNSAKLAKGGFTDTSTALSATLTVINAYKLGLEDLDSVQSMLLQTQNKGVTTVGELGDALASVTPTAASFGVKFADIATSLALMTKQGTNTRVATTALAQVISELGKSGTTASENLQKASESAGLAETSFTGLLNEGYSLGQILEVMNQYAQKNNKSMVDMFSSVEAGRATLQLVGDNAEDFNDILESMENSSGLVSDSFGKTVDQSERLSSAWANFKSQIGMKLQPTVASLQSGLAGVIEKMTGQDAAAYSLAETTDWLKTKTDAAKKAQDEFKGSLQGTTEELTTQQKIQYLSYVMSIADNYESVTKSLDKARTEQEFYNNEIDKYEKSIGELNQKYGWTYDDIIEKATLAQGSVGGLKKQFKEASETERSMLNNIWLNYESYKEQYKSISETVKDGEETLENYMKTVAEAVNSGVVSLSTLRAYNADFAAEVENALRDIQSQASDTGDIAKDKADKTGDSLSDLAKRYSEVTLQADKMYDTLSNPDDANETISKLVSIRDKLKDIIKEAEKVGNTAVFDAANESLKKLDSNIRKLGWNELVASFIDKLKEAGPALAQSIGSAFEDLTYNLVMTDKQVEAFSEQIAELDAQLEELTGNHEDNIGEIEEAQQRLNDATARGNAADIASAERQLKQLKEKKAALEKEKETVEANKKAVENTSYAWKSMSKVALEGLASVLESLGSQLAAQAVTLLLTQGQRWLSPIALAGSVAAYAAAGAVKAAANKYEQGGIVPGNSRHGDQIVARVNSGELILNAAQQDNLARIIEASAVLAQANGGGSGITVNFEGVSFYGLDEPAVGKAIYENIKTLQYEGVIR